MNRRQFFVGLVCAVFVKPSPPTLMERLRPEIDELVKRFAVMEAQALRTARSVEALARSMR